MPHPSATKNTLNGKLKQKYFLLKLMYKIQVEL